MYLYIRMCIYFVALPSPPLLCWYLVLGYLPALHPIFTGYVQAFMCIWMNGISHSHVATMNFWHISPDHALENIP